jgi:hypothetical protein
VRVADLLIWSFPRVNNPKRWHRKSMYRALAKWAVPAGKRGYWRANAALQRLINPPE